jgi:hypothetical protein
MQGLSPRQCDPAAMLKRGRFLFISERKPRNQRAARLCPCHPFRRRLWKAQRSVILSRHQKAAWCVAEKPSEAFCPP